MTYIDGFLIPVSKNNKQRFIDFANDFDAKFLEWGALRVVECWGDDVPEGKQTDFYRAVQVNREENVVFSWVEWPDKATREEGMKKMQAAMATDPKMDPEKNPIPFDGMRMVFGGFQMVVEFK